MPTQHLRARVLNAVYKNKSDVIASHLPDLNAEMVEEALHVSCEYCHPECAAVLLPLGNASKIGGLLDATMLSDNIAQQQQMIDMLLPLLPDEDCEWIAERACEFYWPDAFSQVVNRVSGAEGTKVQMDWAAIHGKIEDIKTLAPLCDMFQLNRALFLAAEHSQWDAARILIPICEPLEVLLDMDTEQRNGHGHYMARMERLTELIDEVQSEQQRDRLIKQVEHQSTKKTSSRKI